MNYTTRQRKVIGALLYLLMNNEAVGILTTDELCAELIKLLLMEPITPEIQAIADRTILVFNPYHEAISTRNIDLEIGTQDVDAYKIEQTTLTTKLNVFEAKIIVLLPTTFETVIKLLKLDNKSVFTRGKQSDQMRELSELKTKVADDDTLHTLVADVNNMISQTTGIFEQKADQFREVRADRIDIYKLKQAVADMMLWNFFSIGNQFPLNPFKVTEFYKLSIAKRKKKDPNFLYKNEFLIKALQGAILNLPQIKFNFKDHLLVENKSKLAIYIYLSLIVDGVISTIAKKIEPGKSLEFPIEEIGSSIQFNLMIAFAEDETITEECEVKITLIRKK